MKNMNPVSIKLVQEREKRKIEFGMEKKTPFMKQGQKNNDSDNDSIQDPDDSDDEPFVKAYHKNLNSEKFHDLHRVKYPFDRPSLDDQQMISEVFDKIEQDISTSQQLTKKLSNRSFTLNAINKDNFT